MSGKNSGPARGGATGGGSRGGASGGGGAPAGGKPAPPSYSKAAASAPAPQAAPQSSAAPAPKKPQAEPQQEIFRAEISFQQLQKTQDEIDQKAAATKQAEAPPKPKEEPKEQPKEQPRKEVKKEEPKEEPKKEVKEEPKEQKKEEKQVEVSRENTEEAGDDKMSREQSDVIPEPTIIEHPLEHKWVFWGDKYTDQSQKHANYEDSLQEIAEVSTIEQFWGAYNNLPAPSKLPSAYELHLFKKGIRPLWEDPQNAKGGNWTFFFSEHTTLLDIDTNWRQLVLTAIGGILDENNYINGVALIRRGVLNKCRYQVWTKVSRKTDAQFHLNLEKHVKDILQKSYKSADYKDQEKVAEEKSGPRYRGKNMN